jgi:hypothetical protein
LGGSKMKRKIILVSVITIVLVIAGCKSSFKSDNNDLVLKPIIMPGSGETNELHESKFLFKDNVAFEKKNFVYKFKKEIVDENFAKNVSKRFIFNDSNIPKSNEDAFTFDDDKRVLRIEKNTGMWSFNDLLKSHSAPKDKLNISDDAKVIEVAKTVLNKYGLNAEDFNKPTVTNQTEEKANETTKKILAKDVYFYKKINGKPILGTSRVIVTIGNNDEVYSISKYFRDVEEKPFEIKLKSKDTILTEIKENKGIVNYNGKNKTPKEIELNSLEVSYWDDGANDFLQPVYVVKGTNKDDSNDKLEAYIQAVEEGQKIN